MRLALGILSLLVGCAAHAQSGYVWNFQTLGALTNMRTAPLLFGGYASAVVQDTGIFVYTSAGSPDLTNSFPASGGGIWTKVGWTSSGGGGGEYLPLTGGTMTGDLVVPTEAYGAGWDGSLEVPTKDALYDHIQGLVIGSGVGTVTNVAMTVPAEFSVAGSPITTGGTFAVSKANQTANYVWAGPTTGAAAAPTFRALVDADIPSAIARDSEVSAAYQPLDADLTTLATLNGGSLTNLNGSSIASGTVADARIDAAIARDAEVAAAYAALGAASNALTGDLSVGGTLYTDTIDTDTLVLGTALGVASGGTGRDTLTQSALLTGAGTSPVGLLLSVTNTVAGWDADGNLTNYPTSSFGSGGGSGDVVGPASSTAYEVAIFDDTTGKLLGLSGITASNGVLTVGTLNVDLLDVTSYDFGGITNLVGTGLTNNNGVLESISGGAGTVTSVGMTVPTGLAVSGSPVTTSGTLALSWSGTIPNTSLDTDLQTLATLDGGSLTNLNGASIQSGTVNSNALDAATLALLGGGGGSGDVVGPASSTAYEVAIFDDTTGKLLGLSGITASNGVLTVGTLNVDLLDVDEYDFGGITNFVGSGLTNNNGTLEATSGGGGTVTSVALSAPAEFSVSGSPVTTSGTLTFSKANQNANLIYAGPSSGGAAAPTFRSLATNDMPAGVTLDDEAAAAYQPLDSDLTTLATLNGAALTNLNGSSIASGTVADARIDAAIARDAEVAAAYEPLNANKYQATNTFLTTLAGVGAATGTNNVMRTRTGVYRDLFISAGAMVPSTTNGAATGTFGPLASDAGDTTKDVFDFDDTTSESVQFSLTLPDTWDLGTLKIKLGYSQKSATTGTNVLSVAAKAVSSGDSFVGAFGTAVTTTNVVADSTNKLTIVTTGALTVGGTPAAGDEIVFKVSRLPTDDYDVASGDLRLHWLRLQYTESTTEPSAW